MTVRELMETMLVEYKSLTGLKPGSICVSDYTRKLLLDAGVFDQDRYVQIFNIESVLMNREGNMDVVYGNFNTGITYQGILVYVNPEVSDNKIILMR